MRELKCLRCGKQMEFVGREKLQLGEYGALLGHISNLIAGAMELDIFTCPQCGKVEFYRPVMSRQDEAGPYTDPDMPQRKCPNCGNIHDFDYPQCPYCKFDYYA